LKAGAHKAVDGNGPDVAKRIIDAAGGPVLAVIDLVNGTQTARFAFGALRKGGKLIQVGLFGGELMLPLPIMAIRALTVQGSYVGNPKELRELIRLAQDGSLNALPVATVPQNRADEALMRLRDGKVTGRLVLKAEAS
jgi:alcohol dehydrogenase/propanol-preferring alcohol dehydrogenase